MSTKWINISREKHVVVVPESTEVTDAMPNTPVNFIAVFGAAREGKSFLQGVLMHNDGVFPVSSSAAPCTSGVDLSRNTLSHAEFMGIPSSEDAGGMPSIGFLDVEGSGAEDMEHNLKLALPSLLLSKVVIFNWKGAPRKTEVLEKLLILQNAADTLNLSTEEKSDVFGHLVFVARDLEEHRAREVEKVVFDLEEDLDAEGSEERAMNDRNKARKKLRRAFQSIKVWCLPLPHPKINDTKPVSLSEVTQEFRSSIHGLRGYLADHLSTPHRFGGGYVLGGATLQPLMANICESVSKGERIAPLSVMQHIQEQQAKTTAKNVLALFEATMTQDLLGDEMLLPARTEGIISEAKEEALNGYDETTKDYRDSLDSEIRDAIVSSLDRLAGQARQGQERRIAELKGMLKEFHRKAVEEIQEKAGEIGLTSFDDESEFETAWNGLRGKVFQGLQIETIRIVPDIALRAYLESSCNDFGEAAEVIHTLSLAEYQHSVELKEAKDEAGRLRDMEEHHKRREEILMKLGAVLVGVATHYLASQDNREPFYALPSSYHSGLTAPSPFPQLSLPSPLPRSSSTSSSTSSSSTTYSPPGTP